MADSFLEDGIIADEDKEIVRFGLESLEGNLLGIGFTMAVGICFKQGGEALLLWALLFPLRKNAGGYHATTRVRCLLMSVLMLITAFMIFAVFEHTMIFYGICGIVAGGVIWALAPVDNPAKNLDVVEHRVYQRRTRIALGVEGSIFALALLFKWEMATKSVCMTFFIVFMSLLLGKMNNKRIRNG